MRRNLDYRLYLVTDRTMVKNRSLSELVEIAVDNGVTVVQLRDKESGIKEFTRQALKLRQVLKPYRIPLIINDRVEVALAVDADGIHLGQSDMDPAEARYLLGNDKIIGLSVENEQDVDRAEELDVDYLGVSPIFSTPTKTDTIGAWGLNGLSEISRKSRRKLVAIGGLDYSNAMQVIRNGADGIAVVSAICAADNPAAATQQLRLLIDRALADRET